jgi:hypothetical protein
LRVPAPAVWRRGQPIGDASVWTDPNSDTAYLSVRALRTPVDREAQIKLLGDEARQREGFIEIGTSDLTDGNRRTTVLRYSWSDGSQQRFAAVAFVSPEEDGPAAVIEARGQAAEQPSLDMVLETCLTGTTYKPTATEPATP